MSHRVFQLIRKPALFLYRPTDQAEHVQVVVEASEMVQEIVHDSPTVEIGQNAAAGAASFHTCVPAKTRIRNVQSKERRAGSDVYPIDIDRLTVDHRLLSP